MTMEISFKFGLGDVVAICIPDLKEDQPIVGMVCAAKAEIHSERHFYEIWRTNDGSICSTWIAGELLKLVKSGI